MRRIKFKQGELVRYTGESKHFHDPDFIGLVGRTLKESGDRFAWVKFEGKEALGIYLENLELVNRYDKDGWV